MIAVQYIADALLGRAEDIRRRTKWCKWHGEKEIRQEKGNQKTVLNLKSTFFNEGVPIAKGQDVARGRCRVCLIAAKDGQMKDDLG